MPGFTASERGWRWRLLLGRRNLAGKRHPRGVLRAQDLRSVEGGRRGGGGGCRSVVQAAPSRGWAHPASCRVEVGRAGLLPAPSVPLEAGCGRVKEGSGEHAAPGGARPSARGAAPAAPPPARRAKACNGDPGEALPARAIIAWLGGGSAASGRTVPSRGTRGGQSGTRVAPAPVSPRAFISSVVQHGAKTRLSPHPGTVPPGARLFPNPCPPCEVPLGEQGMSDQTGENPGKRAESLESPCFDRFIPFRLALRFVRLSGICPSQQGVASGQPRAHGPPAGGWKMGSQLADGGCAERRALRAEGTLTTGLYAFLNEKKIKIPRERKKKKKHHAVSPPASALARSGSVMAAGKRNRKCCACHLLRLDRGTAGARAASPGISARRGTGGAPRHRLLQPPRLLGCAHLGPAPSSAPRGETPSPARRDVGRSPKRSVLVRELAAGLCLGSRAACCVAKLPRAPRGRQGSRCPRLLGGCSLLRRLGLGSGGSSIGLAKTL